MMIAVMGFLFSGICAGPAAAQELQGTSFATGAFSWQHRLRSYYLQSAEGIIDSSVTLQDREEAPRARLASRSILGLEPHQRASRLTRFTRLAGMFMGRVSALSVGNMSICFNLELR